MEVNTMYIGMDVHKTFCQATVINEKKEIVAIEKFQTERKAIETFFRQFPGSKAALESTGIWEYVYDTMTACGVETVLSNPLKTRMIADAKIKTDKVDSLILAQLLMSDMIPECHVPEKDIRDLRKDVRERIVLKKITTSLKNHIYSELIRNGIQYKDGILNSKRGRDWARNVLSEPRLDSSFKILDMVGNEIDDFNHERLLPKFEQNEKAQLLATIDGVGYYTALTVVSELDDVNRFPDTDAIVSYCGLAPTVHQSSTTVRYGPISKCGSTHLRWILVEAAHSHITHCKNKNECNLCKFHARIARRRGKKKAAVATAAKLVRIMYWMLKLNQPYRYQGLNPVG
jgi:transposase